MAAAAPAISLPSPPPSPRSSHSPARVRTPDLVSSDIYMRLPMPRSSSAMSTSTASTMSEPPEKPAGIHVEAVGKLTLDMDALALKMPARYYGEGEAVLDSPEGPASTFTFGTCPSVPVTSTPTAELGPFEYPAASTSTARARPALTDLDVRPPATGGVTLGRRGSIALGQIPRLAQTAAPFVPPARRPSHPPSQPSPPPSRRSSTCSSLATLPMSGRRPSILHSATAQAVGGENALPLVAKVAVPPSPRSPTFHPASPSIHPVSPRPHRGSIAFAQQPMVAPIPPSLLARRGSLPAASLMDERRTSAPAPPQPRPSLPLVPGYTTTTTALYHRRDSAEAAAAVAAIGAQVRSRFPSHSSGAGSSRSSVASRASILSGDGRGSIMSAHSDGSHGSHRSRLSHAAHAAHTAHASHRPTHSGTLDLDRFRRAIDESPLDPPALRTPATPAGAAVFTDPWAAAGVGSTVLGFAMKRERPGLETIPSDGGSEREGELEH